MLESDSYTVTPSHRSPLEGEGKGGGELSRKTFLAVAVFITAYMAALLYPFLVPTRLWWYEPILREWRYHTFGSPVAMDYYGRVFLALGFGAVAGGLSVPAAKILRLNLAPGSFIVRLFAGYAAILTVSALTVTAWLFTHRTILPPGVP